MLKPQNIEDFISSLSDLELKYFFTYRYESLIEFYKSLIDIEFQNRSIDKNSIELNEKIFSSENKHCQRCGSSLAQIFKKDLDYRDPDSLPKGAIYKLIFKGYNHLSSFECTICSFVYE